LTFSVLYRLCVRVFVTGATGFVGSSVVRELLDDGHHVTGLARSDASAAALRDVGADVHQGSLEDLDSLRSGAAASDGVIHLAFDNGFADYAAAGAADQRAIETIGAALEASDRPFVVTSGTLALAFAPGIGTEDDASDPSLPRVASEHIATALASRGVRASIVRLAPCVHDETRAGLATRLIDIAKEKGVSAYVGDGSNVWPGVHRLDAAHLFCLALDQAPAGTRLHAVGDDGASLRDIAAVIGQRLDVPVVSIGADEAADHFGFLGMLVSLDNPTSSALTQERFDWQPTRPTLIEDLAG
jgi:nucleoside-diphosphate-sugar epimerase